MSIEWGRKIRNRKAVYETLGDDITHETNIWKTKVRAKRELICIPTFARNITLWNMFN